jgi:hypothetical protein
MKYRVVVGDPFGGYVCIKANLEKDEADRIAENEDVDYFTTVQVVEDDNILYKHLVPLEI